MKKTIILMAFIGNTLCGYSQVDTISTNVYQYNSNFGIGVSAPESKLHVKDGISSLIYRYDSGNSQLKIGNSGSGYSGLILDAADGDGVGSDYFNIYQDDSLNLKLESMYYAGDIVFMTKLGLGQTPVKESMRIAKGGNVGIGIANPNHKLEIDGDINLTSGHNFLVDGNPISLSNSVWQNKNSNAYYINGNVGIGLSDPESKLHVKDGISSLIYRYDSGNSQLKIGNSGSGYSGLILDAADGDGIGSDYFNIYQDDSLNLKLESMYHAGDIVFMTKLGLGQTPVKESMRIAKGGNVGIGTQKPKAKLQIADGDVYISDIEKGIIMKSPDGSCWKGVLDNSGQLTFSLVDCPDTETLNTVQQLNTTENINVSENILVYPNPSESLITIDLLNAQLKKPEYRIYNISGQIQASGRVKSGVQTIDISNLAKGTYLLDVFDKKRAVIINEKIIKK